MEIILSASWALLRYLRFITITACVETSAGGLLVHHGIIRTLVSASCALNYISIFCYIEEAL